MAGPARAFPGRELHLIGPLQSNKAREAVELFDVIETVDRESLAGRRTRQGDRQSRARAPGCWSRSTRATSPRRPASRRRRRRLHRVLPGALGPGDRRPMCIPPADEPPSPHFALLCAIAAGMGCGLLSMGMSADFEAAIQMGATHVRVGSAIFGHRGCRSAREAASPREARPLAADEWPRSRASAKSGTASRAAPAADQRRGVQRRHQPDRVKPAAAAAVTPERLSSKADRAVRRAAEPREAGEVGQRVGLARSSSSPITRRRSAAAARWRPASSRHWRGARW